jgi:aldose 1-epimerase
MASITSRPFGVTRSGDAVTEYTLSNPGGLSVSVLDYGCIIRSIIVPAKSGPVDVVLGYDTLENYEDDTAFFGAFVGRYANRIEGAQFTLGGKTYELEKNDGNNHLHGCFASKIYHVKAFGDSLLMEAESPDGEDGFPGNMKISVRYTLTPDNAFRMEYRASSDADTVVNLTNHSYFNLNGEGDVRDQKLRLYCSHFLEGNKETCPTGRVLPVRGTPMDFTAGKRIGQDFDSTDPQIVQVGNGYDHNFIIDRVHGASQSICAWASSDKTGISMKIYTTQPGVQLYTGNFVGENKLPGKNGAKNIKYGGFALETQHYPCSPSHPEFPSTVLYAGKVFRATTTLRFFTGKQCGRL